MQCFLGFARFVTLSLVRCWLIPLKHLLRIRTTRESRMDGRSELPGKGAVAGARPEVAGARRGDRDGPAGPVESRASGKAQDAQKSPATPNKHSDANETHLRRSSEPSSPASGRKGSGDLGSISDWTRSSDDEEDRKIKDKKTVHGRRSSLERARSDPVVISSDEDDSRPANVDAVSTAPPKHVLRRYPPKGIEVVIVINEPEDEGIRETIRSLKYPKRLHFRKKPSSTPATSKAVDSGDASFSDSEEEEVPLRDRLAKRNASKKPSSTRKLLKRKKAEQSSNENSDADSERSEARTRRPRRKPTTKKVRAEETPSESSSEEDSDSSTAENRSSERPGTAKKSSAALLLGKVHAEPKFALPETSIAANLGGSRWSLQKRLAASQPAQPAKVPLKHDKDKASEAGNASTKRPRSPSLENSAKKPAREVIDVDFDAVDFAIPTTSVAGNRLKDLPKRRPSLTIKPPEKKVADQSQKKKKKLYDTPSSADEDITRESGHRRVRSGAAKSNALAGLKARREAKLQGKSLTISLESSSSSEDDKAISVDSSDLDEDVQGFVVPDKGSVKLPAAFSKERHYDLAEAIPKVMEFYLSTFFHPEDFPTLVREAKDSALLELREPLEDLISKIEKRKQAIPETSWSQEFRAALDYYPTLTMIEFQVERRDKCSACNKTQNVHYRVDTKGTPYDPFSCVSRQEQFDRGHEASRGHLYPKHPPSAGSYLLGVSCAKKVRRFHELSHALHRLRRACVFEAQDFWQKYQKNPADSADRRRLEERGKEDFLKDHWYSLAMAVFRLMENRGQIQKQIEIIQTNYDAAVGLHD